MVFVVVEKKIKHATTINQTHHPLTNSCVWEYRCIELKHRAGSLKDIHNNLNVITTDKVKAPATAHHLSIWYYILPLMWYSLPDRTSLLSLLCMSSLVSVLLQSFVGSVPAGGWRVWAGPPSPGRCVPSGCGCTPRWTCWTPSPSPPRRTAGTCSNTNIQKTTLDKTDHHQPGGIIFHLA